MFSSFFDPQENLLGEVEDLKLQVTLEKEKNKLLSDEVNWLKEQLRSLKRNQFGKKSERWETPEQAVMFNEAEVESKKPDPSSESEEDLESESESSQVKGHTRKARGHRRPLPEGLTREIVKLELPIEEQVSDAGEKLKVIGWEISEKLKYEPAKVSVVQYHRAKYGVDSGDYVKTTPPLPSLIPQGIATPELLTAIIIRKYADGLPLYRMQDIFLREGIDLTRGTMARWVVKVGMACRPLFNILADRWSESDYVGIDETHTQVLKENGRKAESKSWMIVRSIPYGPKKVVLFDYSTSRSTDTMKEFFADYKGFVQSDALSSYDFLNKRTEDVVHVGCNMHGRRRFEGAAVDGAKSGQSLGAKGVELYKKIYDLEELIKEKPCDERYQVRLEIAKPIFEELKDWSTQQNVKVPKKSKIGDAFAYFLSNYNELTAYLRDGRLNPDNGFTERAIRKFAIGRNNWMFADTEAGAEASAIIYSLVVTAKVNGVNSYEALAKILTQLPMAKTIEDFERLTELLLTPEPKPANQTI